MESLWRKIRVVWATAGCAATVGFVGWSLIAYRASEEARAATVTDARVQVDRFDGSWRFLPPRKPQGLGLLFFPGGLVDPVAYAPLARSAALAGFPALLVELPRRGAFGGADGNGVLDVGVINFAIPRAEFHRYLQRIVEAGFVKRVMFGSDQMNWPAAIDRAIQSIESASFLSAEQKRDIFFHNAARFLRLSQEQIAAMHAGKGK